ncbi:Rv3235 family protein [Cellulomonas pakistanensis]|uniref:Uncharacterized protein n=1 Tax=Cellulomonas pakistanensis TaxID=992287 RepID=A0A919PC01_9CELL|nr:Rv3235 family protein [Cellulomonas pakistanensis]GIG36139.1 hypothetical protein Cpa01nite_15200 [Cellulomonas pakistanensis]
MSTAVDVRLVPAPPPLPPPAVADGGPVAPPAAAASVGPAAAIAGPAAAPVAPEGPPGTLVARAPAAPAPPAPPAPPREVTPRVVGTARTRSTPVPPARAAGTRGREQPTRAARGVPVGAGGGAPGLDPRQASCMVALAAVEVLDGSRPLAQLARWLTPEVYDALARRAALTAPAGRVLDAAASTRDLATDQGSAPAGVARRPFVRRVRVHRVDDATLEATVVVAHADRVRAVALRLTRSTGRWRAAALVVG